MLAQLAPGPLARLPHDTTAPHGYAKPCPYPHLVARGGWLRCGASRRVGLAQGQPHTSSFTNKGLPPSSIVNVSNVPWLRSRGAGPGFVSRRLISSCKRVDW